MFLGIFTTSRKLVAIHLFLVIKTQPKHQIKDNARGTLLVDLIFEITPEKEGKSLFESSIF